MSTRRRTPKPAEVSPPSPPNGVDYTAVLLEEMRAQNRAVMEAVLGCASKSDVAACATKSDVAACATKSDLAAFATKSDLAAFATKSDLAVFDRRLGSVEATVRQNSEELRGMRGELREVARRVDATALTALEHRVAVLERRAGV